MSSAHQVDGHVLTLLKNGADYFPHLIAAIDGASASIYLETYIFADDGVGHEVAAAMQRAVRRGVAVHLLLDGYGSANFPKNWLAELRDSGVQVLKFRPEISWLTLRRQRLRRLHRKLSVIDGRIAFVGGINIIDDMDGEDITAPRLDYAVKIEGGTVLNVQAAVRRLWMMVSWLAFRHRHDVILPRPQPPAASRQVMLLVRDNLRNRRRIEQAYLSAIANARHEILLANAYFLPSRNFRQALRQAAERGVKVVLLLQGKIEYRLQHYATLSLYDELLGAGVQIYQYHASYLHAKVAVVDGDWATVGSSNIEPFSLWLAREANLVVRDQAFAAALRDDLLDEMARGASMVDHAAWSRRGIWVRVATHLSYLFMKFLTSLIGMSRGKEDV